MLDLNELKTAVDQGRVDRERVIVVIRKKRRSAPSLASTLVDDSLHGRITPAHAGKT